MSRNVSANTSSSFDQEAFEHGLNKWVDQAPDEERGGRLEAGRRILECQRGNLNTLNLSSLNLTSLPTEIGSLTQLQNLVLSTNRLTQLPAEFGNLVRLRVLGLSQNQFTQIPAEIWSLTQLKILDFGDNKITELPAGIEHLVQLEALDFHDNRLDALSAEIKNLAQLQTLDLSGNRLVQLLTEIGDLAQLQNLDISRNQLLGLPAEIVNLAQLRDLNLANNQLATIPDAFFTTERREILELNLDDNNRISYEETQRLSASAARNGRITLSLPLYEEEQPFENQDVVEKIIAATPEEKKDAITNFLQRDELAAFNRFLEQCARTAGWTNNQETMVGALSQIVDAMSQNDFLKAKCLALATTAFDTCGDSVAISCANMLLAKNVDQMPIAEMNPAQLFNYARQETVVKFLNEKAESRLADLEARNAEIAKLRASGVATDEIKIDEIETYLAYLQAAPQLGVALSTTDMLFNHYSNVSGEDLAAAVAEFNSQNIGLLVANYIYEDPELGRYPEIRQIIEEVSGGVNSDVLDNESNAEYLTRLEEAQGQIESLAIPTIRNFLAGRMNILASSASNSSSSAACEEAVSLEDVSFSLLEDRSTSSSVRPRAVSALIDSDISTGQSPKKPRTK